MERESSIGEERTEQQQQLMDPARYHHTADCSGRSSHSAPPDSAWLEGPAGPTPQFPVDGVQDDPCPTVEHKFLSVDGVDALSTRNVFVRYLRPPTPPPPGPIIIQEVREPELPPPPPLVVKESRPPTAADQQPPPLLLRECPPAKPTPIPAKIITKRLPPQFPPPLRQKIVERYPLVPPPRPRDVIIERWLPYPPPPANRPVIYQRAPPSQTHQHQTPKNKIINYHFPRPTAAATQRVYNLGVFKADPDSYYFRDCVPAHQLISHLNQIGIDQTAQIHAPPADEYATLGSQWSNYDPGETTQQQGCRCPFCGKQRQTPHFANDSNCYDTRNSQQWLGWGMNQAHMQAAAAAAAAAAHHAERMNRAAPEKKRSKSAKRFF